jgi:parvulin-like peptidyl-prolyl isomerase
MVLANEEFVDLDEINQNIDSNKKQETPVQKKENVKESVQQETSKVPQEKTSSVQINNVSEEKKKVEKPKVELASKDVKTPLETKKTPKVVITQVVPKIVSKSKENKRVQKKNSAKVNKLNKVATPSKVESKSKLNKSKNKNSKDTNWPMIALLIIAVVIVGVVIYMALSGGFVKSEKDSVVAVINGEPIYKSEVVGRSNLLKTTIDPAISDEQVLNMTITDKLLVQKARKMGLITTDEEVKSVLVDIMTKNGIDESALKSDLEAKNISYDFLFKLYRDTITINKLINESMNNLSVSDDEIKQFYDDNIDLIQMPDMVQVRHILFLFGNETENQTYDRSKVVLNKINNDKSNFCTLVSTYSEDPGSLDSCGEYNFSKDFPFVPEFLDAGFTMIPGDVKTIKTQLGYHIMYKVSNIPGKLPQLNEVEDGLRPIILQEKSVKAYQLLISTLRDDAIIEIYNKNVPADSFKDVNPVASISAEKSTPDVQIEKLKANSSNEIVETTNTIEVTKQIEITPESKKMLLANCLFEKGAKMFVASWSPDVKSQLALFEKYNSSLNIVECDPESKDANLIECNAVLKKQFPTWPTWQISGDLYEGEQSLAALAKYSGCSY